MDRRGGAFPAEGFRAIAGWLAAGEPALPMNIESLRNIAPIPVHQSADSKVHRPNARIIDGPAAGLP